MDFYNGYQQLAPIEGHPVITIGNFDGVHTGHQEILRITIEKSRAAGQKSLAYTFRPHPQLALRPEPKIELLSTYEERAEHLARAGLDFLVEEPFSREFSSIPPDVFFNEVLIQSLRASEIVVGYDFGFGKNRAGHLDSLKTLCQRVGVRLTVIPPQGAEVVSSSKIRQSLKNGDIARANQMLGYSFFYRGVVLRGENRGQRLGFPTANLQVNEKIWISQGVYATRTQILPGGKKYHSVTNVGVRPTFHSGAGGAIIPTVETHLLDAEAALNIYGKKIQVEFIAHLRPEMKFQNGEQLKVQIQKDIENARARLAS